MRAIPAGDKLTMLCEYMFQKTGARLDPSTTQGFAILSDQNDFVAAVLVSNVRYYEGKPIDCEVSCASESGVAWRPHVCGAVFNYIFGQLGCTRCTSITRKNNTKSRAFLEALNFQLEGNVRRGYDGEKDALVYGLLREECRYFPGVLNG
jgi:hypothetical protein